MKDIFYREVELIKKEHKKMLDFIDFIKIEDSFSLKFKPSDTKKITSNLPEAEFYEPDRKRKNRKSK